MRKGSHIFVAEPSRLAPGYLYDAHTRDLLSTADTSYTGEGGGRGIGA